MENKKQNFKRISENRVNKIITTLQQLSNLTNTSFYEYSKEDIISLFRLIENESEKTKKRLLDHLEKKGGEFKL